MDAKRPWLSVYGERVSERIIEGSLTRFLEEAVEKYRDNTALTEGEHRISYGGLLLLTEKLAAALSEIGGRER